MDYALDYNCYGCDCTLPSGVEEWHKGKAYCPECIDHIQAHDEELDEMEELAFGNWD